MKRAILFIFAFNLFSLAFSNLAAENPGERKTDNNSLAGYQEFQPDITSRRLSPKRSCFIIDGRVVKLKNGVSEERYDKQSTSKIVTRYTGTNSKGDLNGDCKNDMIVILTQETGGSGTFYYVAAVSSEDGRYMGSNAVLLGDRIKIKSIEINKTEVLVSYPDHQADEPMSSTPTKEHVKTLVFESGRLTEKQKSASIAGQIWKWEKTIHSNDEIIIPKEKEAFTLYFGEDGKISITTDCNSYSGTFMVDKNKLLFGPMMSTRKYCEGSQEEIFIKSINETDSFFINAESKLILQLKSGKGSILFNKY